ncbi:MAG: ketopantoate reductase family protein [Thermoplasmatales archaeon]|nr:ketopantoate reductase family protein [Thermoplasmatales archaeon]
MRILVFGAGSMGSLFGGFLSQRYDVTLVGRKKHMEQIKRNGLKITGKTNRMFYPKTGTKRGGKYDLVILTVKAYDTRKSMNMLKSIIDGNTIILSLQNGLGNEKIVMDSLKNKGSKKGLSKRNIGVLRGITAHGAIFVKPGEIHHSGMGETVIGEIYGKKTERIKKICSMFNSVGIKTRISNDIKKDVWAKTIVNSAINPVTAVTGLKNGYLLKIPMLTNLMENICIEGVKVANASGVFFDSDVFEETKKIAGLTSENRSSMLQDIESGKKTEIDFINGAIAKIGKRHGIETPLNNMLTGMVKGIGEKG